MSEGDEGTATNSSAKKSIDLVCAGEALVVGTELREETDDESSMVVRVGGADFNVALALRHAGHAVSFATRLGNDPFGGLIRRTASAAGLDLIVETDEIAPTGFYVRERSTSGRRVHYYRRGSAGSRLPDLATLEAAVARSRALHLTGITAALHSGNTDLLHRLMDTARHARCLISLDINFRPQLWTASEASAAIAPLAQLADIVFVGADEANDLWGTSDPHHIASVLGDGEIVVKDSDRLRVDVLRDGRSTHVPVDATPVVDTVGAGDAFAAGYLHAALLGDQEPVNRVQTGHSFAAAALASSADSLTFDAVQRALTDAGRALSEQPARHKGR